MSAGSGEHVVDAGALVVHVRCPAKGCGVSGKLCALCGGTRRVPRVIAERYMFPNAHGSNLADPR